MGVTVYKFGGFKLDCDRFELVRGNRSLKLERKPMELLTLLAARKGNLVTRAEIAERLWEQEVFVDTEHGINTAVRKIRQVLMDTTGEPRFVRTVTGKGYRFIGVVEEELVLPEAPQTMESLPMLAAALPVRLPSQTLPEKRRSYRAWAGAGAAVLTAGAVLSWGVSHRSRGAGIAIRSLAVLPLQNLTGEPAQEYVADGMTDELIAMLAKSSTLRITSRTSVMQYKGVHRPLPEIARELGVDAILEGSISRSGEKTHMTVQLIEAADDRHVWAESYDRDSRGLVSLPKDTAQAIAKQLKSSVPQQSTPAYVSPEAHDAYQHGRYLWFTDHTEQAGPYFKRATELQPDYALGWSGLATYYEASAVKGELSPADSFAAMDFASSRALALDDSLPEAHLAAAGTALAAHWDLAKAEAETLRAIDLDPAFAEAHHLRAKILAADNRQVDAIEAQRRATDLDPFRRPWAMALALSEARQYDAALQEANDKLIAYPSDSILIWLTHVIYERMGRQAESVDALAKSLILNEHQTLADSLRQAFQRGGYQAVLQWKMDGLRKRAQTRYVTPVEMASLQAKLGHREEALQLLEEAYRQRAVGLLWIQTDPAFDSLHSEQRYRLIVRGVGLPAAS